jgi:hypothetical protein
MGEKMAKEQLNKHTTHHASQSPEAFYGTVHKDAMETLQNKSSHLSPSLTEKSSHLSGDYHHLQPSTASHSSLNPTMEGVDSLTGYGLKRIYNTPYGSSPVIYGGGHELETHMGSLLNYTNPAMTPFIPPANLPQGQISGGSFRAYGSIRQKYGGSFMA